MKKKILSLMLHEYLEVGYQSTSQICFEYEYANDNEYASKVLRDIYDEYKVNTKVLQSILHILSEYTEGCVLRLVEDALRDNLYHEDIEIKDACIRICETLRNQFALDCLILMGEQPKPWFEEYRVEVLQELQSELLILK